MLIKWLEIQTRRARTPAHGAQYYCARDYCARELMISSRAGPASAGNSGHSATAQLDRAPSRRCVASAAVAGRVALSSWLFLPAALYCCVTHEQTSFSTAAYTNHPCLAISTLARCLSAIARMRTAASRVLLMPSPAVCLLLLSKLCLSQCHSLS